MAFTTAHNMLVHYASKCVVTTEVLQNRYTHYGNVFQEMQKTTKLNCSLHKCRPATGEAMTKTIDDQLVLEIHKLEKLEKEERQWISQSRLSLSNVDNIRPQLQ